MSQTTAHAIVTRYPSGCFGIDYQGSMFFWYGFEEKDAYDELKRLRIPPENVRWEERYYDRRFNFGDPRAYRTRPYVPKKNL